MIAILATNKKFFKTKITLSYTHIFTLVLDALEAIGWCGKRVLWISRLKFIRKSWKVEFSRECRVAWDLDEANNLFLVDRIEDNSLSFSHTNIFLPPFLLINCVTIKLTFQKLYYFRECFHRVLALFLGCTWSKSFVSWSRRDLI